MNNTVFEWVGASDEPFQWLAQQPQERFFRGDETPTSPPETTTPSNGKKTESGVACPPCPEKGIMSTGWGLVILTAVGIGGVFLGPKVFC